MSDEQNGNGKRLTGKQRLFIEAYLQCFNKTEAARRAGYQGNYVTLRSVGYENFTKPHIREVIERRMEEISLATNEALALLTMHAIFDPGPFLKIDENGVPSFDIEKLRDAGLMGVVKSITFPRDGSVKYEFESRQGAIEKILKAGGAYKDKGDGSVLTIINTFSGNVGPDNL